MQHLLYFMFRPSTLGIGEKCIGKYSSAHVVKHDIWGTKFFNGLAQSVEPL